MKQPRKHMPILRPRATDASPSSQGFRFALHGVFAVTSQETEGREP